MERPKPAYSVGSDILDAFIDDLQHGEPPERWPLGPGPLAAYVDLGPEQVLVVGGQPGAGKTALATGAVLDAARAVPGLRVLIVNVEMTPNMLLNRQLARISGIPLDFIQNRRVHDLWKPGKELLFNGLVTLSEVLPRVAFLEAPYSLGHVAAAADDFEATCILLDYVQRIRTPGNHDTPRESLEAMMQHLRDIATQGAGVFALSAVARQKDSGKSSYKGLGLASFRGSSELEFGSDSCYILEDETDDKKAKSGTGPEPVALRCFKRRNGPMKDIALHFDRKIQRFTPWELWLEERTKGAGETIKQSDDSEAPTVEGQEYMYEGDDAKLF